ncbi:type I polyketide synthase [Nocardia amamiensis]|uniref:type I polyketide synthase n=1 Tax=Nocardia amamiensis TaxID=404578 RepID=UPI00082D2F2B|nr:type I polyketide synthase [Nocardia amamiensis]
MTIDEQSWREPRSDMDSTSGARDTPSTALVDRLRGGEAFALAFGGQGARWLNPLAELLADTDLEFDAAELVDEAARLVQPVERELALVRPEAFDPLRWILEPNPSCDAVAATPPMSFPGVLLGQLTMIRVLSLLGLDPGHTPPMALIGHSQGLLGASALANNNTRDVELLALAQLLGAAAVLVGRRRGMVGSATYPPMVSVAGVAPDRLRAVVDEFAAQIAAPDAPVVSVRNGRRRVVVSGGAGHLARLRRHCEEITRQQRGERDARTRGGAVFAPVFEPVDVQVGFHHPALAEAIDMVGRWAEQCGLDVAFACEMADKILVSPVDWVAAVDRVVDAGARWILDLGPGDLLTRMTSSVTRGTGVGIVPAATRAGHRNLVTPGAASEPTPAWSTFAPRPVSLPDGRVVVQTAFTALTGRSPILLAGMTPTTVDAGIVAAAANAGHWAELAGGGQVTEQIFADRVAELRTLLAPGRAVQFNALLLDPYLWKLQLGGKRLVQRARAAGAPFDGVVVSAGIPELDAALTLIEELSEAGIAHIVFKPGTVEQIRAVIRIANEVPQLPVIVHIEGGRAGGHHSWEDLDDLLLDTYPELRSRRNVIVCVGGGIGTPERAAQYLTGQWSAGHGHPVMPVDGVLVGTAAMAALEATTSPQVKQLLVDTPGTADWVGAGTATGGMASGRSQLGADLHEIDNSASRTGKMLDEVAGDAEAVDRRRTEIIAALDQTAKPYFGDAATMTYTEWLCRYVELAVGAAPAAGTADSIWLDDTWRDRFGAMLARAQARLDPIDRGPIPALFASTEFLEDPTKAIDVLRREYPDADTALLHPADVPYFVSLCRTPGKPVNFVPVLDGEVRRWWRSDSLWQAHNPRYSADQVCVIPGPVSVAGITRVDEPVGALLDRFEQATTDALLRSGITPIPVPGRRHAGIAAGSVDVVLAAPDVCWAGRTTRSPVARLGPIAEWTIAGNTAIHPPTGSALRALDTDLVELVVPLRGAESLRIRITAPPDAVDGGAPIITSADAETAMTALVGVAAGAQLPEIVEGSAELIFSYSPDLAADHTGVTSSGLPETLEPIRRGVPDVLVGACWPAVFAVLAATRTPGGQRVIEGLLDLVHLDHQVLLDGKLPTTPGALMIRAEASDVLDTDLGRVVEVRVAIGDTSSSSTVASLVERFVIRGRTGDVEASEPPRAGGSDIASATDTPRKRIRDLTMTAPSSMDAFAGVSGDHNPIHTCAAAALLAGLDGPVVHGMWLSAAVQQAVSASDPAAPTSARAITAWTARFLAMVRPGDRVDVHIDRVGIHRGAELVEISCRVGTDLVMIATGQIAAPRTIYAFPGQGIQRTGMGLDARDRSKAAKQVWDRADKHTRDALGFSILAVVRDNPTYLRVRGVDHRHPDGVLHLTQFTQVAMATLGVAQIAELRESGAFVEEALLAGHSVGEYNALAAISAAISLESLLDIVFQRGAAMHGLVPRNAEGRSNYRMAAIRPSQIGLPDDEVIDFIESISARTGEFLEVVNLNLRGSQYAIAGTVDGLTALEAEINGRRAEFGGKRAFILIPGVDVPFHSSVLRTGVPEFRRRLEELIPKDLHPEVLVGRYIPNLVPRLFSLERTFLQEIADLVPSGPLTTVLADYDHWIERPAELCRIVLIELLAWQFASPVRWIETQDLLFADPMHGGLGVERFVEVGLAATPTLANLASQTLKLADFQGAAVDVLNLERDAAIVCGTNLDPESVPEEYVTEETPVAPPAAATVASPAPNRTPDDIAFTAADATAMLIALWTKLRLDQIRPTDTIEELCDGVSSRRNQLLVDLAAELSLGAIDGAAEADMTTLGGTVRKLARTYRPFGSVLSDATADHLRKVLGPSGKRPPAIADRVRTVWQLGAGWASHVTAEVVLGTRDGISMRGGDLGELLPAAPIDAAGVDTAIDASVQRVAARYGVAVVPPSTAEDPSGTVDSVALRELDQRLTGPDGVLASAARHILDDLGLDEQPQPAEAPDSSLIELVSAELGSDWPRMVAPAFDAERAVLIDDRWASAREDLARLWLDPDSLQRAIFADAGAAVAAQARWWQQRAERQGRRDLALRYREIAEDAAHPKDGGEWADDVAVVTGASKDSIAAAITGKLLGGGATVFVTTSRLDDERLAFYRNLYRDSARPGAALWVVPTNLASYRDIDALIEWIGTDHVETVAGVNTLIRAAVTPTLLFPFAAPRVRGELADAGARAELDMRVLLWSIERLIGGLSNLVQRRDSDTTLHVVLPGSPNRGLFGGDGAYGESKAALDAIVAKWKAERSWADRVTLVHALIGWVRGTGLMAHNDPLVDAVEQAGVRTWSSSEMADELLKWAGARARDYTDNRPITVDLTGGLAEAKLDLPTLSVQLSSTTPEPDGESALPTIDALPLPPTIAATPPTPEWGEVAVAPSDLVVIVGAGELGPYGSARTRFDMEVNERLSAAGVVELAWTTGLITWENDPEPGWYDAASGDFVPEAEIAERYHDAVLARCGIRRFGDDGAMVDNTALLLVSVFLDQDLSFVVGSEADARAFAAADPEHTVIGPCQGSTDWRIIRKAGSEIRVPRTMSLSRTVGGQIPTGFDPRRWGISAEMADSVDRVALWNVVATVDAFLSSGFTPAELLRWVHPGLVANSQGTGMGGMSAMRSLYIDTLLGESRANDILQEALPNVVAAHVVQSYIGSYGPMVHPVAACATAAISVEEGLDKIRVGKAEFVVAGGFDDLGIEGIVGFGDMSATADSATMAAKGIADRRFSRANDRRRSGFVESQGGGTILLARGDIALKMGLPVLGVVGWAQSFGDGVQTSIPAPGLGALGAGRGGTDSRLAVALRALGVTPDDIAVISKHDTSTAANDPNESELHERLATALGRSPGAPMFVVSQKSLTGHAKGGAAAFQLIGLCQVLTHGIVPPNRSLDCVDEAMQRYSRLVWPREPLRFGAGFPLKAGLVTSLGFGHVSGLIALVHPEVFVRSIDPEQRAEYLRRASERAALGRQRLVQTMCGGNAPFKRLTDRRLGAEDTEIREREAELLLSDTASLGDDNIYSIRKQGNSAGND